MPANDVGNMTTESFASIVIPISIFVLKGPGRFCRGFNEDPGSPNTLSIIKQVEPICQFHTSTYIRMAMSKKNYKEVLTFLHLICFCSAKWQKEGSQNCNHSLKRNVCIQWRRSAKTRNF